MQTAKIVDFVSHVGNNDVPYPYGVDEKGDYYLIIENVIVSNVPDNMKNDPYTYYYRFNLITEDIGCVPPIQPIAKNFRNIKSFYIGDEQYTFRYQNNIAESYDKWMTNKNNVVSVIKNDGSCQVLSKDDLIELMSEFARKIGVRKLKSENICLTPQQ